MSNPTDRLLGAVAPGPPARLLDDQEVDRMIAEREAAEDKEEESK